MDTSFKDYTALVFFCENLSIKILNKYAIAEYKNAVDIPKSINIFLGADCQLSTSYHSHLISESVKS